MITRQVIPWIILAGFSGGVFADTLFNEGFQDGDAVGWSFDGTGTNQVTDYAGNYSLRLTQTRHGVHTVSTQGYTDVEISMEMAAQYLEYLDTCEGEYSTDNGTSWTSVVSVADGSDDGVTLWSGSTTDPTADDNSQLQIRFRASGQVDWYGDVDYCWGDNVVITGTPMASAPDIALDANPLQFGEQLIGTAIEQRLQVSNAGDQVLNVGTVSSPAAPFSIVADTCTNTAVSPSASCYLDVEFAPTTVASFQDSFTINSDDPDEGSILVDVFGEGTDTEPVYDPLSGDGSVSRSELTADYLSGNGTVAEVSMSAFALPATAANPSHSFEGRLVLNETATSGVFTEHKDDFDYADWSDDPIKHLPEFDYGFYQNGTHLIPVDRGPQPNSHPNWEYILQPGRVWNENGDNGLTRAALPFALEQKNANCVHNGMMMFLFDDSGIVSDIAYQISSETCLYFKFDLWGRSDASYLMESIANAASLTSDYEQEVSNRMPTKDITELANDFPGTDVSQFGHSSEVTPEHMSLYGVVANGTNYVGGCDTRAGAYPYCETLVVPSYSTAKSVFAGVGLMRLEKLYPGSQDTTISSQITDCANHGTWSDVTIEDAVDMATGNYDSASYMVDEGAAHTDDLFLPEDHASKIDYSCTYYSRKATPGTQWIYHTSDTYIAGTAMNEVLKANAGSAADIFTDVMVTDLLTPLETSPVTRVSRRTYDTVAQPFTGWGLTFVADDVAKLSTFLNVDDGMIGGQMMLDQNLFDGAMQRSSADPGLSPKANYRYNNGFWAKDMSAESICANETYIPLMSGYGGITVAMFPNDITYYYFSDNDEFSYALAASEINNMTGYCQ